MSRSIALLIIVLAGFSAVMGEEWWDSRFVKGEVLSVGVAEILIATDRGPVSAHIAPDTKFKKLLAENPRLSGAAAADAGELVIGDRVLITGAFRPSQINIAAKIVYIIPLAEIERKIVRESELWAKKGISGRVTKVDPSINLVTLETRGSDSKRSVAVSFKSSTIIRRYSSESVRYADARPGRLVDVRPGDTLRALGAYGRDVRTYDADVVVSGSFRTLVGRVVGVVENTAEIVVENVRTRRYVTVSFVPGSELRRFPASMAESLVVNAADSGNLARRDIESLFAGLPRITLTDLKIGDVVAISTSQSIDGDRLSALKLLVGVDLFVRRRPPCEHHGGQADTGDWPEQPTFEGLESP